MQTINFHYKDTQNTGDRASAPFLYFKDLGTIQDFIPPFENFENIVVGGGGIIFERPRTDIYKIAQAARGKKIIWGAGFNSTNTIVIRECDDLKNYDLIGIRDYGVGYEWVPCASCMHEGFNIKRDIKNDIVFYIHYSSGKIRWRKHPQMINNCFLEEALDFIGSANTVITNTYHGMYWGILMQKKVVLIEPFVSPRFHYFKYKVPIIRNEDDFKNLNFDKLPSYNCLDECREKNLKYYKKVKELIC